MSIVDTPKKDVSQAEENALTSKLRTPSINYYFSLFYVQYVLCIIALIVLRRNVSC